MQTQTQSDHILDVLHTGSGRVQKMQQNTQAMEEQYKALLQNIVSSGSMSDPETGKPWLPSENFFKVVREQFKNLKDELKAEKDQNEGLLSNAHQAVQNCSDARSASFSAAGTGVIALQGAMQAARTSHRTCRLDENGKIATMEDECGKFDNIQSKCSDNQDWYAAFDENSIAVASESNTLQSVVTQAGVCVVAVDAETTKANECDGLQTAFHSSFCKYEKDLSAVCKKYNDCYDLQKSNLLTTRASVEALEGEQKTIWRMVGKVECYLQVLTDATADHMPTQADITGCTQLQPDDSELNIGYKTVIEKEECMKNAALNNDLASETHRPGAGTWYNDEFDADMQLHEKLNADQGCSR